MEPQTFLEHYRVSRQFDGSLFELSRAGAAISYKGKDTRTGAPVLVTLLPVADVEPEKRENFMEKSQAALQLDHENLARILAAGEQDDQFVFVAASPNGETLESWIAASGPLPPDAVLRVALQVVRALTAIHSADLTHAGIQPSNLVIVPGQTWEGEWPFIKLVNVAPQGWRNISGLTEFSSPERIEHGKTDFRSEIYSLGATMCFLLTGAFSAAQPRAQQTKRFTPPLRKLIAPMLSDDPNTRPHDASLFELALRDCLKAVERRQNVSRKFGIPFHAVKRAPGSARRRGAGGAPVPLLAAISNEPSLSPGAASALEKPVLANGHNPGEPLEAGDEIEEPRRWISGRALAWAAVLIALITLAAVLLPAPVGMILGRDRKMVGVPVDTPSPTQVARNDFNTGPASSAAPSQPAASIAPVASPPVMANSSPALTAPVVPPSPPPLLASNSAGSGREADPPATGPTAPPTLWEKASGQHRPLHVETVDGANDHSATPNEAEHSTASSANDSETDSSASSNSDNKTTSKDPSVAANTRQPGSSASNRARPRNSNAYDNSNQGTPAPRVNSGRPRYVGITPQGNLILRYPSGKIVIVPPWAARMTVPQARPYRNYPAPPYQPFYPPGN